MERGLKTYERAVYLDSLVEQLKSDVVYHRVQYVEFVSASNGFGRKKRPQREVRLLLVDGTHAFQVVDGEVKPRVYRDYIGIDRVAEIVMTDTPHDQRTADNLLDRAIANWQLEQKIAELAQDLDGRL